ncbi:MAG: hypothetical protein KDI56_15985, partial [Xanthomonadales bacterium]|nr:hypothetical protein [Xanthomonadales bacterium]
MSALARRAWLARVLRRGAVRQFHCCTPQAGELQPQIELSSGYSLRHRVTQSGTPYADLTGNSVEVHISVYDQSVQLAQTVSQLIHRRRR